MPYCFENFLSMVHLIYNAQFLLLHTYFIHSNIGYLPTSALCNEEIDSSAVRFPRNLRRERIQPQVHPWRYHAIGISLLCLVTKTNCDWALPVTKPGPQRRPSRSTKVGAAGHHRAAVEGGAAAKWGGEFGSYCERALKTVRVMFWKNCKHKGKVIERKRENMCV